MSPTSDDWTARSNDILVNVPTATSVKVDAAGGRMINLLVGNPDSHVSVEGELYRGRMLTLGELELNGTRLEAGRLTATPPSRVPAGRPGRPSRAVDRPRLPTASPSTSSTAPALSKSASTTTSSSTTTTTIVAGTVPHGEPAVLGAAFSLGGAATSTQWWIGLPVSVLGLLLLTSSWLIPVLIASRPAALVRRLARAGRPARSRTAGHSALMIE